MTGRRKYRDLPGANHNLGDQVNIYKHIEKVDLEGLLTEIQTVHHDCMTRYHERLVGSNKVFDDLTSQLGQNAQVWTDLLESLIEDIDELRGKNKPREDRAEELLARMKNSMATLLEEIDRYQVAWETAEAPWPGLETEPDPEPKNIEPDELLGC